MVTKQNDQMEIGFWEMFPSSRAEAEARRRVERGAY
jgi:hypothetical protein